MQVSGKRRESGENENSIQAKEWGRGNPGVRGRRRRGPEREVEEGGTSELEKSCQLDPRRRERNRGGNSGGHGEWQVGERRCWRPRMWMERGKWPALQAGRMF